MPERIRLEQDIIASVLYNPKGFIPVKKCLKPEYFSIEAHQRIASAFHTCVEQGIPIDLVNVPQIGKIKAGDDILLYGLPLINGHLPLLAKALAEEVIREKFIGFKEIIVPDADVFELLDSLRKLENETTSIITANTRRDKTDILNSYVEYLLKNGENGVKRISTPFHTLNQMLKGGFDSGGYTLLGGTPGSGKTSFMLSLAYYAAQNGVKTGFIEGEMTECEILERLNGIATGEDIGRIREGKGFKELSQSFISGLFNLPFELVTCYERTLNILVDMVRECVHRECKLIFCDYLQVFAPKGKQEDEYSQIKKVSETLRSLALKNHVHIFVATSLNRSEKDSQKLTLNSFYGSSQLGHDCSLGMILSGEQNNLKELIEPERNVTLNIVKNRNGVRGEIGLKFNLSSQRFEECLPVQQMRTQTDDIF